MDRSATEKAVKNCSVHAKGTVLNPVAFEDLVVTEANEIWIQFNGKLYRLQTTKQGKLILTK